MGGSLATRPRLALDRVSACEETDDSTIFPGDNRLLRGHARAATSYGCPGCLLVILVGLTLHEVGARGINTVEPRNIEAILSDKFDGEFKISNKVT
jgi:hypothetical protein